MYISPLLKDVLDAIVSKGGRPYFVGGCVRDYLLNKECHDYDIEVFHLELTQLYDILSEFGTVNQFGKSFAILKLSQLNDVDFALPRTERKTGDKHNDFEVQINPDLPIEKAIIRRDLTINALMYDYKNHTLIDLCNGKYDLEHKIIRCVHPDTFIEDPLRVLRIAQFKARFDFEVHKDTVELCKDMVKKGMLEHLSDERVYEEYCKMLMSPQPSIAFEFLKEIQALPDYHSEGNVFNHTMLVVDVGAWIKHKTSNPLGFMWACLLHDIGKPSVTTIDLRSPDHARVGAELFEDIKLINNLKLRRYISTLIRYHMTLMYLARNKKGEYGYYKVLKNIEDQVPIMDLYYISCADKLGRGSVNINEYNENVAYLDMLIDQYGTTALVPYIKGQDLIDHGFKDKKNYKKILDEAYDMQLKGYHIEDIYRRLQEIYD